MFFKFSLYFRRFRYKKYCDFHYFPRDFKLKKKIYTLLIFFFLTQLTKFPNFKKIWACQYLSWSRFFVSNCNKYVEAISKAFRFHVSHDKY